jgi:hypothetical protein
MDTQDLSNNDSVFWRYLFDVAVAVGCGIVFGTEVSPVMMAVEVVEEMYWDITKAKVCWKMSSFPYHEGQLVGLVHPILGIVYTAELENMLAIVGAVHHASRVAFLVVVRYVWHHLYFFFQHPKQKKVEFFFVIFILHTLSLKSLIRQ